MTKSKRIANIIIGLITLAFSIILFLFPKNGCSAILAILGLSMLIYGIRSLWYYLTMARHMVGGKYSLYLGVIALDFGMFTLTITHIPHLYIVAYLMFCNAFTGVIDILRGLEARSYECPWKLTTTRGIVNVLIAIACCVFIRSESVLVDIYAAGLIYSSCIRIITAFRRSAIVYIQ